MLYVIQLLFLGVSRAHVKEGFPQGALGMTEIVVSGHAHMSLTS